MDAPSLTPERSRELADLRRRAYGPDADIHRDPEALDRLHELEELVRIEAESATPPVQVEPPARARADAAAPPAPTQPTATIVDESSDSAPTTPAATPRVREWWRRGIVWGIAAVCLLVGVAVGAWGYSMTLPRPDFTLQVDPTSGERAGNWNSVLSSWGVDPGSAVPYGDYNGLDIWTVVSDTGARCILVTHDSNPVSVSCAAQDLDPTMDLTVYPGLEVYFDTPPPEGTVIRFVARTSGIDVWVRGPGAIQSQGLDTSWSVSIPSEP
jgi:hypothetical protein